MKNPALRRFQRRAFHRERGVVLESRPGPRSSLWLWVYGTRSGMLGLVAEAARRPKKHWSGVLAPFSIGWLTYCRWDDDRPARLIQFDLIWSPYVATDVQRRPFTPQTLVFTAFCAEVAIGCLSGHPADPRFFEDLSFLAHALFGMWPYRGLALAWAWEVLAQLGELGLESTCLACGQSVHAAAVAVGWDDGGHLWHKSCLAESTAVGVEVPRTMVPILTALHHDGLPVLGRHPVWIRQLAQWRQGWHFFRRRIETLLGRPLQSLQVASRL